MKKTVENIDDHTVAHDTATLGISTTLGVAAAAVTGDPAVGVATTVGLTAIGIGAMRVGPVRRTVNRAVLAFADEAGEK